MPLVEVVQALACPVCGGALTASGSALTCAAGHSFDVARGGTVTLADHRANLSTADTAEMVGDRAAFYDAGHYAAIIQAVVNVIDALEQPTDALVVDAGAGTGHLLAAILQAHAGWRGIALDSSRPAVRMAARRSPRITGIAADLWRPWPLGDSTVDVVVTMFAPRNAAEVERVLRIGGAWIIVLPVEGHLAQLRDRLTMLGIPAGKVEDVTSTLPAGLNQENSAHVQHELVLTRAEAAQLVRMGPNRHHLSDEDLAQQTRGLADTEHVTQVVDILKLRRSR